MEQIRVGFLEEGKTTEDLEVVGFSNRQDLDRRQGRPWCVWGEPKDR